MEGSVRIGLFGVKITPEASRRLWERQKELEQETYAKLPPEEQKELAERDERLKATEGFQQVGESGE